MIAALIVVVLVTAVDAESAQTGGVARALEEALEPGSVVLVRASESAPDQSDLGAVAASARADAVAAVTWKHNDGGNAHVRVQRANASGATERDLDFKPSDASVERGRTVGFAIASMLPNLGAVAVEPPPQVIAKEQPSPPRAPSSHADVAAVPVLPWSVDIALATMTGVGGSAGGFGGEVGLRRELTPIIDARAALTITRGGVSDAQGALTIVRPRVGLGITVAQASTLAVRVRVEGGPWLHVVSRSGKGRAEGSRWLPGAEIAAEIAWVFAPRVALTVDLGLDVAFGTTRVLVGGEERASIPPVRAVGGAGVRLVF